MYRRKFKKPALLVSFLFVFGIFSFAQNIDSIKITGVFNKISLIDLLSRFEKQYSVHFYYKNEWFTGDSVNLSFDNTSLSEALNKITDTRPFLYNVIQNNLIVFMPKEKVALLTGEMVDLSSSSNDVSTMVIGNPREMGKYKVAELRGRVVDAKTGAACIGSTLQIENTNIGAVTDLDGYYVFNVKPGIYTLVVTSIGYEKMVYKIKLISNGKLDVELFDKSIKLKEVTIYAQRADRNVWQNQMSMVELDAVALKLLPAINGEKDIIRSMIMMPGVKNIGEFGSGINVRGGGEDQNLYLIEGAPLFNTSHVFGLLSAINPDAVNSINLYKGHIPANYGERISSVMDIQVKDNNGKKLKGKGGIGIYDSRLMVEGPIYKNLVSFMVGGRTSYSDWILKRMPDYYLHNSSANFYDANGLINLNLKNNQVSIFGYTSHDKFNYAKQLAFGYGNNLASLDWDFYTKHNLTSTLKLAYSQYNVEVDTLVPKYEKSRTNYQVNYSSGKYNIAYTGLNKHTINAGVNAIFYRIWPGNHQPLDTLSLSNPASLKPEQAYETAIYFNDLIELNKNISVNIGLRISKYAYLGPSNYLWLFAK